MVWRSVSKRHNSTQSPRRRVTQKKVRRSFMAANRTIESHTDPENDIISLSKTRRDHTATVMIEDMDVNAGVASEIFSLYEIVIRTVVSNKERYSGGLPILLCSSPRV